MFDRYTLCQLELLYKTSKRTGTVRRQEKGWDRPSPAGDLGKGEDMQRRRGADCGDGRKEIKDWRFEGCKDLTAGGREGTDRAIDQGKVRSYAFWLRTR